MELAVHIRHFSETAQLGSISDHLGMYYDLGPLNDACLPPADRIYIGDEFCPMRLPNDKAIVRYAQFSLINDIGLTLLTPVMTDIWLDRCAPVFDALANYVPKAEVVVNDLGTLHLLKRRYPGFLLSMGRLFNKGFKDPRMSSNKLALSKDMEGYLNESTFDHPEFEDIVTALKVSRVERDIMPNAGYMPTNHKNYSTSYYFPFGYVTTGRVCWTAGFAKNAIDTYKPLYQCARPCEDLTFHLSNDSTQTDLLQCGNTIFYRYSIGLMAALMNQAQQGHDRLIYQGVSL